MREVGLVGVTRDAQCRTTRPDPSAERPPDLVDRLFLADAPNQLWVVDFTYLSTWQQTAYTAHVIDVYSRRIVGWRCAASMPTELPLDALEMALFTRTRAGEDIAGVVHHSDAGSQLVDSLHDEARRRGRAPVDRALKSRMRPLRRALEDWRRARAHHAPGNTRCPSNPVRLSVVWGPRGTPLTDGEHHYERTTA